MTILEVLRMSGRGASAQFRFGHRKPGSTMALLFELTDKHLKDCERMYVSSSSPYLEKKRFIFLHLFMCLIYCPVITSAKRILNQHEIFCTAHIFRTLHNLAFDFILIIVIERKRFSLQHFPFPGDRSKLVTTLTIKRSFTARNTGELPIEIYGFYINDWHCEGYGFKILDCTPFKLNPNATKRIEIAFTPDFTLSRVERKLLVMTSMGPDVGENVENGVMILNLLAVLPAHSLNLCASVLARPPWEGAVQKAALILSSVLMLCVAVVSFLEADRILREGLANYSKENPVQPPLDLRLLSHISTHNTTQGSNNGGNCIANKNEKTSTSDEKNKTKKDEAFPDWSLMNVKKCKDKDVQKRLKIPDWSAEEERRFKLDIESKDLMSFKKCEESSNINNVNAANTTNTYGSKKKNNKKQNNSQETQSDNCVTNDTLADTQLVPEKKFTVNAVTKSSPISNRKGKTQPMQSSTKEEPKLNDHEIQIDAAIINNYRTNKRNKQTNSNGNNNSNHNNHVSLKKLEPASTQKTVHLSEEETSSTTTESSTHDETTSCKVSVNYINLIKSK